MSSLVEYFSKSFPNDVLGYISSYLPFKLHGMLDCCSSALLESGFTWDHITHLPQLKLYPPERLTERLAQHHKGITSAVDFNFNSPCNRSLFISIAPQLQHLGLYLHSGSAAALIDILNALNIRKLDSLHLRIFMPEINLDYLVAVERLLPNLRTLHIASNGKFHQSILDSIERICSIDKMRSLLFEIGYHAGQKQEEHVVLAIRRAIKRFHGSLDTFDLLRYGAELSFYLPELAVDDWFDYDAMDLLCQQHYGVPLNRFNTNRQNHDIRATSHDIFTVSFRDCRFVSVLEEWKQRVFPRVGPFFERMYFYEGTLVDPPGCLNAIRSFVDQPIASEMTQVASISEPMTRALDQLVLYDRDDIFQTTFITLAKAYRKRINWGAVPALDRLKHYIELHEGTNRSIDVLVRYLRENRGINCFYPLFQDKPWLDRMGFDLGRGVIFVFCHRMELFNLIADYARSFVAQEQFRITVLQAIWKLNSARTGRKFSPNPEKEPLIEEFAQSLREQTGLALPDFEEDAKGLEFSKDSQKEDLGEIIFRDIVRNGVDAQDVSQRCDNARKWCSLPIWADNFISFNDKSYVRFTTLEDDRAKMLVEAMYDGIVMAPVRRYRAAIVPDLE